MNLNFTEFVIAVIVIPWGSRVSLWSGDAAVSFNALMSSWQEKATSLNNILIDLSDNLRGTAKDQAANEEDNQSRTSKLQALLG